MTDAAILSACRASADALLAYVSTIKAFTSGHGSQMKALSKRRQSVHEHHRSLLEECITPRPDIGWVVELLQHLVEALFRYINYALPPNVTSVTLHVWSLLPRLEVTP